ncbi:MAG: MFS transporter [Acidimicrobiales bacterium]
MSGAGNGAALVVLPWLVLERTGSPGSAGLLAAVTALPLLASSLFSGTVVDTLGRQRAAVGADLLSCASVAAIPLVDRAFGLNLGWLVVLAVVGAVFDPAGVTARETMLPEAAAAARMPLERANGLHEAVWSVAYIVGPGAGGVLIAWVGAIDALWIAAVGFAASAAFVALLRLPGTSAPHPDDEPDGMWAGTKAGLRFVRHDPLLLAITLLSAVLISVYMPVEGVLLPVHFEALDEPGRLGSTFVAMSVGGIVGALAYSAWGARFRRSLVFRLSLVLTTAFIVVLAVLPSFPLMLVASFGIGTAYGPIGPLVNLAMQARSPQHMRGRVMGIITSTEYAAGPVGYLLVGAATARWGVEPTFVALAVVLALVAVAGLFVRDLGELDGLVAPTEPDEDHPLASALDEATRSPLPLVHPPRDPDQLSR